MPVVEGSGVMLGVVDSVPFTEGVGIFTGVIDGVAGTEAEDGSVSGMITVMVFVSV